MLICLKYLIQAHKVLFHEDRGRNLSPTQNKNTFLNMAINIMMIFRIKWNKY